MISWIKNGVQVSSGTRFLVNSSTGVLEIRDIGKEDEGRWECAARNSIGFASEVFELRVIGKLFSDLFSKKGLDHGTVNKSIISYQYHIIHVSIVFCINFVDGVNPR